MLFKTDDDGLFNTISPKETRNKIENYLYSIDH